MHRVRPEQPIEIARGGWLDAHAALGDEGGEPMRGILGGDQPHHLALRIGERRLDGVEAEQDHAVGIGAGDAASRVLPVSCCRARSDVLVCPALVFGALGGSRSRDGMREKVWFR